MQVCFRTSRDHAAAHVSSPVSCAGHTEELRYEIKALPIITEPPGKATPPTAQCLLEDLGPRQQRLHVPL